MSALYYLVLNQHRQETITHIQSIADDAAVDQVFFQDEYARTAIITPVSARRHWNSFS